MGGIGLGMGKSWVLSEQGGQQEEESEKTTLVRVCTGLLGVLHRGGSQYGLGLIIFENAGTADCSWSCARCYRPI